MQGCPSGTGLVDERVTRGAAPWARAWSSDTGGRYELPRLWPMGKQGMAAHDMTLRENT